MSDISYALHDRPVSLTEFSDAIADETTKVILSTLLKSFQGYTLNSICPVHNEPPHVTLTYANDTISVRVVNCCETFSKRSTSPLEHTTDHFKTAHFRPDLRLAFEVQGEGSLFSFDAQRIDRLTIGRADSDGDHIPDIDLEPHGAIEHGISRDHAAVIWWDGALHIVDNDSGNGTFIDEQRLNPRQPYMLHDGDLLRLGSLVLNVRLMGAAPAEI